MFQIDLRKTRNKQDKDIFLTTIISMTLDTHILVSRYLEFNIYKKEDLRYND